MSWRKINYAKFLMLSSILKRYHCLEHIFQMPTSRKQWISRGLILKNPTCMRWKESKLVRELSVQSNSAALLLFLWTPWLLVWRVASHFDNACLLLSQSHVCVAHLPTNAVFVRIGLVSHSLEPPWHVRRRRSFSSILQLFVCKWLKLTDATVYFSMGLIWYDNLQVSTFAELTQHPSATHGITEFHCVVIYLV